MTSPDSAWRRTRLRARSRSVATLRAIEKSQARNESAPPRSDRTFWRARRNVSESASAASSLSPNRRTRNPIRPFPYAT